MSNRKLPPETPGMKEARTEVLRQVKTLAPSKTGVFQKAFTTGSLRKAITAHCLSCSDYKTSLVRDCSVYGCCLFNVRPYQHPQSEKAKPSEVKAGAENAEESNSLSIL